MNKLQEGGLSELLSSRGGNHSAMAIGNREVVLESIFRRESVSQRQLMKNTGLKAPTISKIIRDFKGSGIVHEHGILESSRVGPKEVALGINNSYCFAAAMSMDHRGYELCLSNASGHILISEKIGPEVAYQDLLDTLPSRIKALTEKRGLTSSRFAGFGVSVSGVIDAASGVVLYSNALKMKNFNLRGVLEKKLGVPVLMERNLQCGAYMEQFHGVAKLHDTFLYYLLRRDEHGELEQSLGLVINRQSYRGSNSAAGEMDGFFAPVQNVPDAEVKDFDQFYASFSPALAAIINLFDPSCLVICSDEKALSDERFDMMKQAIFDRLLPVPGRQFSIQRSTLGIGGMLKGTCLMTVHRYLRSKVSDLSPAAEEKPCEAFVG